MHPSPNDGPHAPQLVPTAEGLVLICEGMELRADFSRLKPRVKAGRLQQELLVKAAKVKGVATPLALDATAGLGEDSFLLAAAGFSVELYERNPTMAALLADALARAADDPELGRVVSRMHLHTSDSVDALRALESAPDVVYLDPMFPARRKSAAVKKKPQLMQQFEPPCSDEEAVALLQAALEARPRKVVVKRPVKGPCLADLKPAYVVEGKSIRYDCYVPIRG